MTALDESGLDDLFKTYERVTVDRKKVAEVTEGNVTQLAAMIRGQVDYSGDTPAVIAPLASGRTWRVKVGDQVSLSNGEPPSLVNQNGFNQSGDWQEVTP